MREQPSVADRRVAYRSRDPVSSDELNALRRAAWREGEVGDQDWARVLSHSLGWVCAYEDGRLVGFVNVAWDGGSHAFLLDTTVHPSAQRSGIGSELVRRAARLASHEGAEWLHVDFEPELRPFYEACGFRPAEAGLIDLTSYE